MLFPFPGIIRLECLLRRPQLCPAAGPPGDAWLSCRLGSVEPCSQPTPPSPRSRINGAVAQARACWSRLVPPGHVCQLASDSSTSLRKHHPNLPACVAPCSSACSLPKSACRRPFTGLRLTGGVTGGCWSLHSTGRLCFRARLGTNGSCRRRRRSSSRWQCRCRRDRVRRLRQHAAFNQPKDPKRSS